MSLNNYDSIYFLGIGGIGMSNLARWFKKAGKKISGYDKTPTPLTHELMEEGMEIHFDDKIELIPGYVSKARTLVVYTPAIPKNHTELNYLKDNGFTMMKRSEVLGLITKDYKTIAVAGTHGKTTTSSIVSHILKTAGVDMVGFLGGITTNYESNLVMHGEAGKNTWAVVEADEFDRSFLRLFPQITVVTSADADHLDIYGDHASMVESFKQFIGQVAEDGTVVIHESVAHLAAGKTREIYTYGMSRGQFFAGNIIPMRREFFEFDLIGPDRKIEKIQLGVPGFHNMENAIAATIVALKLGIDETVGSFLSSISSVLTGRLRRSS